MAITHEGRTFQDNSLEATSIRGNMFRFLKEIIEKTAPKHTGLTDLNNLLQTLWKWSSADIDTQVVYDLIMKIAYPLAVVSSEQWVVLCERHVDYEGDDVKGIYSSMEAAVKAFPAIFNEHGGYGGFGDKYDEDRWMPDVISGTRGKPFVSKEYDDGSGVQYTLYWYKVE